MSQTVPVWVRGGAKGFHFSVEVVAIGMATNLLGSAGTVTGPYGMLAAACFLAAGILAVVLIQKIEVANGNALATVAVQAAMGNKPSFRDAYRNEVANGTAAATRLGHAEWFLVAAGAVLFLIDRYGGSAWC